MLKSAGLVFISQVVMMVVLFLRNILIARLISVEDFGLAVNLSIAVAFIENASYIGMQRMIVQDRDGESRHFQAALHMLQVIRGVLGGLAALALAIPYAHFIGVPEVGWAFAVLALLPLLRGFQHLDFARFERNMQFGATVTITWASPILSLVVALLVYFISADYQMMLWAIVAQQIAQCVLSHLLAERRFELAWDMAIMRRALAFGIPLLANGLLLFALTNGDRLIITNQFGLEVLGWFSAAFMLVQAVATLVKRTFSSVVLPKLSAQADNRAIQAATLQMGLFLGIGLGLGMMFIGPALLLTAFDMRYAPALEVLAILALIQSVLMFKGTIATVAMSMADTLNAVYGNLPRLVSFPIAFWAAQSGYDLIAVLLIGLVGELFGTGLSLALLKRQRGVPLRSLALPTGLALAVGGLALWDSLQNPPSPEMFVAWNLNHVGLFILSCCFVVSLRELLNIVLRRR
ncbi:oligosaccharide flippase family protein [Primorskyibacter sp. S187A]|uniref:oligosaccharide flippase family protein n=1 Tax=Primorskyibacter sp. S187A TaxID=3415130 RepID=UPI003C7ED329